MQSLKKKIIEKYLDLYLYYVKGVEDGPRIEKRMLKFQQKVERMMKRRGIALVAYKLEDGQISMSYVPEEKWDEQKEKVQQQIMDEMMKEEGDKIEVKPEEHL